MTQENKNVAPSGTIKLAPKIAATLLASLAFSISISQGQEAAVSPEDAATEHLSPDQQTSETPTPAFCSTDTGFNDFDFWLGNWRVTTMKDGSYAGSNQITKIEDGCLIMETWKGAHGTSGTSMNYYNPATKVWRQVWVDNAGYSIDYSGGLENGAMVLVGTFYAHATGAEIPIRGIFEPMEDGDVRQIFEVQNKETGEWTRNWDARYTLTDKGEVSP